MTKNLSYFMREQKEEIVNAPAPESFVDENGNRLELEIKTISNDKIRKNSRQLPQAFYCSG